MVNGGRGERQTLAKVSVYLDSVIIDGDFLARDQSALVAGLLEGHTVLCLLLAETGASPFFAISRGNHVASA
jgi:hypothetical protein